MIIRVACSLAACMVLAACSGFMATHSAQAGKAHTTSFNASSRPVYLRAMKTQLATPRASIGRRFEGTHCMPKGEVIWDDALFRQLSRQLPKIFRRDLQDAHYRVPPESEPEIDIAGSDGIHSNYVQVDMQVQEARADLCMQEEGTSGSVHIKVLWQVYAAGTATPLYETTTLGNYQAPTMEKRATADFFTHAFSAALSNLLAERGFQEALLPVSR